MDQIYDILPMYNSANNSEGPPLQQTATKEPENCDDDVDELTELFIYFNNLTEILEILGNDRCSIDAGNQLPNYENLSFFDKYPDYRKELTREILRSIPYYENIDIVYNTPTPDYQNVFVHNYHLRPFRNNNEERRTQNRQSYEPIYLPVSGLLKKTFFQKIKDFFNCTVEDSPYILPLTKIIYNNGDVYYKYTKDNEIVVPPNSSKLPLHEDEEEIYYSIDEAEDLPNILNRPLPTPPAPSPKKTVFFEDNEEAIYEEIGFMRENGTYDLKIYNEHEANDDLYMNISARRRPNTIYDTIAGGSDITYDEIRWSEDVKQTKRKEILAFIWTLVTATMYITDVGSDISLAFHYWTIGNTTNCALTLSVVYIASVIDFVYSIYREEFFGKTYTYKFGVTIMFVLNVRGVFEYYCLLRLQYRDLKMASLNKVMKRNLQLQKARIATLNSYEGLFEACPQIVLQLYLIFKKNNEKIIIHQALTLMLSLCASGTAFVNMEKGVRLEDYGIHDLSIVGIIVQYLWLSPLTASRLLSVSLLLLVTPLWLCIIIATIHVLLCAALYWWWNTMRASLRKAVNACVFGARVLISPYEPEYVPYVVPALIIVHTLQNAAATAVWAKAALSSTPSTSSMSSTSNTSIILVTTVCTINFSTHILGLFFGLVFHKRKHRFYTLKKIKFVSYGYDVVQVV